MMRKQFIMDKALELFAKQGFEATSVQQITDYCGISKGAFYLSFKSKDELIVSIMEQFMEQFISDIDHVVKTVNPEQLLHTFYDKIIQLFNKHSSFSKFIFQESMFFLKKELIEHALYYNRLFDQTVLELLDRCYGETIQHTKYELASSVKYFIRMYSELMLFKNIDLTVDLQQLVASLVEKTNILAKQMEITFITKDVFQLPFKMYDEKKTKTDIISLITEKIDEIDDSITKESLLLLKDHVENGTLKDAIVIGLLENVQNNPQTKWVAYLLREHLY